MDNEVEIMIFKDDDGYWQWITSNDVGTPVNRFKTYEDLIRSLPKHIRERLEQ
jgi:hypothetical protein